MAIQLGAMPDALPSANADPDEAGERTRKPARSGDRR